MKAFDYVKRALHFIASVFMYSILLILVLIAITVVVYFVEEKQNINKDHYVSPLLSAYVILTNSMEPTILVKDAVVDVKALPSSIQVGDVITFVTHDPIHYGATVTHRVVGRDQDANGNYRYRTKGDNNNIEDSWIVPQENILGKVIFKIPKLGYLQDFLSTSYGWIIAIVLPCLVIIVYDLVRLVAVFIRSTRKKLVLDEKDNKTKAAGGKPKKDEDPFKVVPMVEPVEEEDYNLLDNLSVVSDKDVIEEQEKALLFNIEVMQVNEVYKDVILIEPSKKKEIVKINDEVYKDVIRIYPKNKKDKVSIGG